MPVIYDDAPLHERVRASLGKPFQHEAIKAAQDTIGGKRDRVAAENERWEELRSTAAKIRDAVLRDLDGYLAEFARNARANGTHVHFAPTGADAVEIAAGIFEEKGADFCVKAKSLLTEEIGLNEGLAERGVTALETDCAEVVLQTAASAPSHIVVPALHFDRAKIRELFSERLGYEGDEQPEHITRFLRDYLRPKFLEAHVGVTGCNFAVASTGTCTLVTNEGNARMCSSFPETLVVVMGMERVVPDLPSLDVMNELLAGSAVGTKATAYLTLNQGPRRASEGDGPSEVHVIVVDNGRHRALGTKYRDILRCIHCGACMNTCPVYRHITGHGYGSIYPGPVGVVLTPVLEGYERTPKLANACTLCGACACVCPVRIPLNTLILDHRSDANEQGHGSRLEAAVFAGAGAFFGNRALYGALSDVGRVGMGLLWGKQGHLGQGTERLPVVGGWTSSRDLDLMQVKFRTQFKRQKAELEKLNPEHGGAPTKGWREAQAHSAELARERDERRRADDEERARRERKRADAELAKRKARLVAQTQARVAQAGARAAATDGSADVRPGAGARAATPDNARHDDEKGTN